MLSGSEDLRSASRTQIHLDHKRQPRGDCIPTEQAQHARPRNRTQCRLPLPSSFWVVMVSPPPPLPFGWCYSPPFALVLPFSPPPCGWCCLPSPASFGWCCCPLCPLLGGWVRGRVKGAFLPCVNWSGGTCSLGVTQPRSRRAHQRWRGRAQNIDTNGDMAEVSVMS